MTIPIGFLGSGGAPAELFVVHGLIAYSGASFHEPVVAIPNAQVINMGIASYSGATLHNPGVGNAIAHGLAVYGGATFHDPIVNGHFDLTMGLAIYGGASLHAPSLVTAQDVNCGVATYSGATLHAPSVTGEGALQMGLATYSGVTMHGPELTADRVRLVDAWEVTQDHEGTFDPSVGNNRVLLFHIAYEGGTNIGQPTYGGQNLTTIYKSDDTATSGLFYLNEAGIQAATDNEFDFDVGAAVAAVAAIATYENVDQATPIFDSIFNRNATGNTPAADIDTFLNGVVVASAHSGSASNFAWTAPFVEKTDQTTATVTGSVAVVLNPAQTTLTVEAVASDLTANRSAVGAVALRPTLVTINITMPLITYSGATVHAPELEAASFDINLGLATYSGVTMHSPTVAEPPAVTAITALDSWSSFTGTDTGTFTVSSGSNRLLVMTIALESLADEITAPTYGGQTMTKIHNQDVNGGQNAMFYLDEAGIAAASGTTWDADMSVTSGSEIVALGSYENVAQTDTVFSTATGINLAGETANFDLTTIDQGLALAHAYCGALLTFTWDAPLTEVAEGTNGSAGGSTAHELDQDGTNVSIGADADGNPNRTGVVAACFRPLGG